MPVTPINVSSWEEFLDKINQDISRSNSEKEQNPGIYFSDLLFRGHSDHKWELKTTLERYTKNKSFTWDDFHNVLVATLPATDSFTNNQFSVPETMTYGNLPIPDGYDYMIYLRHHNFPTPILDWTRSVYIAAYFAFSPNECDTDPAIYTFREWTNDCKGHQVGDTVISGLGPSVRNTHKRHHIQQCEYTICYAEERDSSQPSSIRKRTYMPHEDGNFSECYNILNKYILPRSERSKIMSMLDQMNINAFTLLGNEEGLASMLAYREIDKRT